MNKFHYALTVVLILIASALQAAEIKVNSFAELATYTSQSGNVISMKPGVYQLNDYWTADSMRVRHDRKQFQFLNFKGDSNVFQLDGVTIEVDNALRLALNAPIHTSLFKVTGNHNTIQGLQIRYVGEGTSRGGAALEIAGTGTVLKKLTLHVTGSSPYGYGDLLGKGDRSLTKLRKHSGLLITGSDTKLYDCKVYMRSLGHAFFIQGGIDSYLENCYAEGEMRSTNDMLKETSGPAFEEGFASIYEGYDGKKSIKPDYMKSLNECGFRTYGAGGSPRRETGKVTLVNCTAKNMRVGFALAANEETAPVTLRDCKAIACERGYYLSKAVSENCSGDMLYGPLLYLVGNERSQIDMILEPGESRYKVHALATICGTGHEVSIQTNKKTKKITAPIMLGYGMPDSGENASPIPEAYAGDVTLTNKTSAPVIVGAEAKNCTVVTQGKVERNKGSNIEIVGK
ncbi:hypothetical protein MKJ04_05455 [Pontibacter sp. E15-1]|uniref:hypothetical protein n=1 Tax=Pontibacter sp. E15-1 TaxID=2919918 RepID=UPI001F4F72D7|nr:hypothetical protein [Pontibacter sp. E15-1]MCJ8164281.1 hypothetical protein [Pontibacter sp. E15-1]